MAIDIRATVSCSLGTVISGSIADDYLQGSGLIKTRGQVVLKGTMTPKIGRGVTFTYTKNGTTRSIPRKLRVLSSFADPFRKITTVQLGCKLTYLSDLAEPVKETIAEQIPAVVYEELKTAISAPLKASGILDKCLEKLGLTAASNPLQNRFIAEEWDLSPGYVQVMNDLLVSESYFGYLDEDEELQIRDLTNDVGRGKLIEADDIVDLSPIGAGNLPGEAVIVNYTFRRLGSGSSTNEDQLVIQDPAEEPEDVKPEDLPEEEKVKYKRNWEFSESVGDIATHDVAFTDSDGVEFVLRTKYIPYSMTHTFYDDQDRVYEQWDETRTVGAAALGNMIAEYLQAGLYPAAANSSGRYFWEGKYTTYQYSDTGEKIAERSVTRVSDAAMLGRLDIQAVWYLSDGTPVPLTYNYIATSPYSDNEGIDYADAEVQETYYYTSEDAVRTETYNYQAWGLTQEGQQAFSRQKGTWRFSDDFVDYFEENAFSLVPIPGQTTLSVNRGQLVPKPRPPELAKAVPLAFPMNVPDEPGGGVTIETATSTLYALGSAESERVVQLTMPVAPDDYWDTNYWNENVAVAYPVVLTKKKSSAQQNAIKYGRVQNRLLLGNRNGISLQLAPERLPKRPFDPLYVKAGGITASYRVNGASWTFDANGIVASVDALLWGAVGADAGTDLASSWIPLAPDTATLPASPAVITPVTPEEVANAPEIQPVAVLPPYIETVPLEAVSHTTASIVVYNHLLTTETETLSLITRTSFTVGTVLASAAGALSLSGQDSTGRYVRGIAGSVGSFVTTGLSAGNVRSYAIGTNTGNFGATGAEASLFYQRLPLILEAASAIVAGQDAGFFKGASLTSSSGSVAIYGQDAGAVRHCQLQSDAGSVALSGMAAGLVYTSPQVSIVSYTGNGTTANAVVGVGFKPGFIWAKRISGAAENHELMPSIVNPDATPTYYSARTNSGSVSSSAAQLVAYDANGFTLQSALANTGSATYWALCFKEGTAAATNTSGSIATTVSVNAMLGFSQFRYVGTGVAGSIGHGLGVAPELIVVQNLNWAYGMAVGGTAIGGANCYLSFRSTDINGMVTEAGYSRTQTFKAFGTDIVGLDTALDVNRSGSKYHGFAFNSVQGVSKVGTFNGNGSATQTVNGVGFSPRFVLVKSFSGGTSNWVMFTQGRDGRFFADTTAVEAATDYISFDGDGFTLESAAGVNSSGVGYVYLALA